MTPLYVVAGPTASGKTGLAIALARRLGTASIINMDSMQLYRELPVLSAQPTPAERAAAPHLLYGVRAAGEPANAAWWAGEAKRAIDGVAAAETGNAGVPILCGGAGLYLQTLLDGIAPIPQVPGSVQAEGIGIIASNGSAALHARLDPAMQAKLQPGDTQRVLRAWTVLRATGRSLAEWQAEPRVGALCTSEGGYDVKMLVLNPPRAALYARCDARFEAMLAAGALDEVRGLLSEDLPPDLPLLKACGYPELARHLRGELSLAAAVGKAQQATRNYAKRQVTWFTNQLAQRQDVFIHSGFGSDDRALTLLVP